MLKATNQNLKFGKQKAEIKNRGREGKAEMLKIVSLRK